MSKSAPQSYVNHRKFSPLYHFALAPLSIILLIASVVYLVKEAFSFLSVLIAVLTLCIILLGMVVRQFATRLQDRIIYQEESQRHLRLTGKPLDERIRLKQVIALRFATDDAFPSLCQQAAEEGLEPARIKQSITKWRPDYLRV
ncbi:DUF6526 family protein [Paenibacillus pinihumi]|uniref:DUF6526 family protein n=1 Tax=Paenibacillus pinihumi TaxID=669462 RepID=UPI0004292D17|nr:DUF6526 family protein [Paenibacillus pinihumi]